ncbi:MAG: sulfur reduction protein DsrE [Chloroflexi bacterium RBG_16_72_14]|nr:MAG: sulfur reduction protein DsrE [Chloroflexi bacterium RBG_16_72_14]
MSKLLYVHTGGVNNPERSATPIYLATTAAAMDVEVGIYFTVNGPTLLRRGTAETLIVPKFDGTGAPLRRFIDQAIDLGVKFYVCQPSLDLHGLNREDLIEGVEMIGGAAFNDMALEADQVICF